METARGYTDWPYKLCLFVMYGAGTIDWIHRQDNRFKLETQPMSKRFNRPVVKIRNGFRALERMGYVYNLRFECGRILFYMNPPQWLSLSDDASLTESKVPPFVCKGVRECDMVETNVY